VLQAAIDVDVPRGVGGHGLGTALAVLAAVLCAVGSVMQQEAAAASVSGGALQWRSLARRPPWLFGQGAVVAGTLLQVAALGLAPVAIVQPVLAGGLLVALGMRALRDRRLPPGGAFVGGACTAVGLATFLIAANPAAARTDVIPGPVAVVITVLLVAVAVEAAVRFGRGRVGALLCGAATGVALGVAAVLTSAALKVLSDHGLLHALRSAPLWAALVTSAIAQYGSQQAFSRGSLSLSLPALTVIDPLAAVPAARLLLGEHLSPGHAVIWAPAAALAAVGVVLLAVTGTNKHPPGGDVGARKNGRSAPTGPPS
jgi:hypothetical protein